MKAVFLANGFFFSFAGNLAASAKKQKKSSRNPAEHTVVIKMNAATYIESGLNIYIL